jgi:Xaa-Pro aminopeptidase
VRVRSSLEASVVADRRARALAAWREGNVLDHPIVIAAGDPISIPGGQDQTYRFRAHPDYRWLTGRNRPGGMLVFDPREGWFDFVAEVGEAERIWEGVEPEIEPGARPLGEFARWWSERASTPIALVGAVGAARADGRSGDAVRSATCCELLAHARRAKDAVELALLRRAAAATAVGFEAAREAIRPGATERSVQIALESAMFTAGCDETGYGTLVGSGPNAAVLHFAPSARRIESDELVLVDAGGAIDGYTADVTRTFGANGPPQGERRALYDAVLAAQIRAIERCRPGIAWRDVHRAAAVDLADGLRSMGVLRTSAEDAVESEAIALFFPHGVGHMVGLGVRDAGGRLPGVPSHGPVAGARLRVELPLAPGYAMTVEPGLYFIAALLRDPVRRERFGAHVRWDVVDRLLALDGRGIGGVRIEDDVVVASDGPPIVLTAAIPK